jgi:outer membrane immunogenic protein
MKFYLPSLILVTLMGAGPVIAADLSTPPPLLKAPVMMPVFTWTGFYVGGNIGGAFPHHNLNDSLFGLNFDNVSNGVFVAGGQAGGNYQINSFVFGIEGTLDWAANHNNHDIGIVVPTLASRLVQASANDKAVLTLTARLGVAFDRLLFYAKGGGGWLAANNVTVTDLRTDASISGSSGGSTTGWVVGAGIEWALANNWTLKAEYDYLGLPSRTFTVPVGATFLGGDTFTSGNNSVQMATVGFNFLFGGGRY